MFRAFFSSPRISCNFAWCVSTMLTMTTRGRVMLYVKKLSWVCVLLSYPAAHFLFLFFFFLLLFFRSSVTLRNSWWICLFLVNSIFSSLSREWLQCQWWKVKILSFLSLFPLETRWMCVLHTRQEKRDRVAGYRNTHNALCFSLSLFPRRSSGSGI